MHADSAEVNAKMEAAAKLLNLKKHLCGFEKQAELSTCIDLEAHKVEVSIIWLP